MVRPSSCSLSAALPQKSSTISSLTPSQNPSIEATVSYAWWAPGQKKRLERLAKTKGVQADIGPCSDDELLALYERCDLFIQASTVELEGMSALEAMAMACPVLLNHSKTSALHELPALPDAFFSDKDSSELTHRLDQFLDSASERSRHSAHNSAPR